jgi:hypothetical protein
MAYLPTLITITRAFTRNRYINWNPYNIRSCIRYSVLNLNYTNTTLTIKFIVSPRSTNYHKQPLRFCNVSLSDSLSNVLSWMVASASISFLLNPSLCKTLKCFLGGEKCLLGWDHPPLHMWLADQPLEVWFFFFFSLLKKLRENKK